MRAQTRNRLRWAQLPPDVRSAVERILGDRVIEAVSQPGGYSPGTADRVRTANGRRAFVKAASPAQNPDTPNMHRTEARITAALPAYAPTPRLLGCHDDGHWVALVFTDVDGRHPVTPWHGEELDAVLDALEQMATALTPSPLTEVPAIADRLADEFAGWRRIVDDPPPGTRRPPPGTDAGRQQHPRNCRLRAATTPQHPRCCCNSRRRPCDRPDVAGAAGGGGKGL
ncbi:hypothetical protein [Verrucosispora sp. WMMD573]|uniref:hypothetical protein n=1 Tax=Verrucosispora sp. WMMD573 TaxID=3015149 RepID=UPI00248BF0BA|nr:hypothetical protein [Verrucosispora sp. WMMD573]WBB54370.1 hypothetical protein O7601_28270 [Verrucosispora sp. WMMD573]